MGLWENKSRLFTITAKVSVMLISPMPRSRGQFSILPHNKSLTRQLYRAVYVHVYRMRLHPHHFATPCNEGIG